MQCRKRTDLILPKVYNPTIIFITTTIGSSDPKSSNNNTGVIVCGVMAVVVVIVTVILIVTCFRYRQILNRENTQAVGKIQNDVYERDTPSQVHTTNGDYEQPTQYAQLDSSKRVLTEENYQSLNAEGYQQLQIDPNENVPQYTSLNTNSNHDDGKNPEESTYEELH